MILEKDNQVIEYEKNRYFYENDKIKNEIENLKNEIKYKNALILEKNSSIEICNEKLLDIKLVTIIPNLIKQTTSIVIYIF